MAVSAPIKTMTGDSAGEYSFEASDLVDRKAAPVEGAEAKPLISKQLLHDACVMYEANRRVGTMRTKTRGEVAGSSKKMFRQKGTGRARMGTKRSPIRVGGGQVFAKRPRDFGYRLPKKALRLATRMALLSKFQDAEATVLDEFTLTEPKTKPVVQMLSAFGYGEKKTLLVVAGENPVAYRSARNIPGVAVMRAADLNAYELLHKKYLVITKEAMDQIRSGEMAGAKAEQAAVEAAASEPATAEAAA